MKCISIVLFVGYSSLQAHHCLITCFLHLASSLSPLNSRIDTAVLTRNPDGCASVSPFVSPPAGLVFFVFLALAPAAPVVRGEREAAALLPAALLVRVLVGGGGGHDVCLGGPPCSAVGFLLPVSLSSLVSLPLSPCLRSLCSHPLKPYQPHRLAHVAHIVLTRIFLSPIYAHRPPSSLSSFSLVPHHGLPNGYPCRHNACDECAAISL